MLTCTNRKSVQPALLLANWGDEVPTHEKHDFKGIPAWGDRQQITIAKSDMKKPALTILISAPVQDNFRISTMTQYYGGVHTLHADTVHFDTIFDEDSKEFSIDLAAQYNYLIKVLTFSGTVTDVKF